MNIEIILFYSVDPNDVLSKQIMIELKKNTEISKLVKTICVSNPNIKIPKAIQGYDMPLIVMRGFTKPLVGKDALSWLAERSSGKCGGLEYAKMDKVNEISDSFGTLDVSANDKSNNYQSLNEFNKDGISPTHHNISNVFSDINDKQNVEIYDESDLKKKNQKDTDKDLQRFMAERDKGVPKPITRIGGNNTNGNNPFGNNAQGYNKSNDINNFNDNVDFMNPKPPPYGISTLNTKTNAITYRNDSNEYRPNIENNRQPIQPPPNPLITNINFQQNSRLNDNIPLCGFGSSSSFSNLDDAYGVSLIAKDSKESFNTRKNISLSPGLPAGRGTMGHNMQKF